MTDVAPDTAAPAPAAVPTQAPAGAGPADEQTPQPVHPAWDNALKGIPDAWQAPIREQIKVTEREMQAAVEKARAESTPQEWRDLVEQATAEGLTPDEFIDAYNGRIDMQRRISENPDGFLSELTAFIDEQVAAGHLTRAEGVAAKKDAKSVVGDDDDDLFATPEAKKLAELQKRLDESDERTAAEKKAAAEAQEAAAQEAAEAAYADEFLGEMHSQLQAEGFVKVENGVEVAVIPPAMIQQIGYAADAMLDANPRLTPKDAMTQAITQFKTAMQQMGGQIPGAPAPKQQVPVLGAGGGGQIPGATPPAALTGDDKSAKIVEMMKQMTGQS